MLPSTPFSILHNAEKNRFETQVDSLVAVLLYKNLGNAILFTSTQVPPELEGRGIGASLVKAGLQYARENHLKVQTTCWFVSGYIKRHPEYQDLQ